jgi:hypothetical protein
VSANPIVEVWGGAASEYKTVFATQEPASAARAGDYIQVSGVAPYDGTWRITKVWRSGAGEPPRTMYGVAEELFSHFGPPEGWPAANRAPSRNASTLTLYGSSSVAAVSGPQKMYIPPGALVTWGAATQGKHPQRFALKDGTGKVVAEAGGASVDGSLEPVGDGRFRGGENPYYTLSFDAAARILPSADPLLWERRLYLVTHTLLTDRTAQDRGFHGLMVELKVFGNA